MVWANVPVRMGNKVWKEDQREGPEKGPGKNGTRQGKGMNVIQWNGPERGKPELHGEMEVAPGNL